MRLSHQRIMSSMVLSIEELRAQAFGMRKEGLNSQQIADELSLSQDTISWLLTEGGTEDRPTDVRIGWRSIGVRPERIAAVGTIMADVSDPEAVAGAFAELEKLCQGLDILINNAGGNRPPQEPWASMENEGSW